MQQLSKSYALIFTTLLVLLGSFHLNAAPAGESQLAQAEQSMQAVNVNSATAEQLSAVLKGIGPKRAADIIAYREASGPFKTKEALLQVKGFGKKTLEKNWDLIVLE